MEELVLAVVDARIKREERKRATHSSQFSKWKVLIGPSDWEDHSLGKKDADRYRVHNLPSTASPGLYELGIAVSGPGLGRNVDATGVVVVYLGQADNVRSRLQSYGRNGSHLNNPDSCGLKNGSGCFKDILSRGFAIVYRWLPMKTKADALEKETELLSKYDYSWNKCCNGIRRHYDVVRKLPCFSQKPGGINIKASNLFFQGQNRGSSAHDDSHIFFPQLFKFIKSNPRLVLDGRGSLPTLTAGGRSQVDGAGLGFSSYVNGESDGHGAQNFTPNCGFVLNDGSPCRRQPVRGNKRCNQHKGRKICGPNSKSEGTSFYFPSVTVDSSPAEASNYNKNSSELYKRGGVHPKVILGGSPDNLSNATICGVELGGGKFCTRPPVERRVRCEEHKGMRVNGVNTKSAAKDKFHADLGSNFSRLDDMKYSSCTSVCGAPTNSGSYCKRPVKGNTRCFQHSYSLSESYTRPRISSAYSDWHGGTSICGAPTRNGSYCRRTVKGGGTCWQH